MNPWDNLPNAKNIDRVLESMKANPKKWVTALDAAYYAARNAAWDAAYDAARDATYDAARDATWDAARNAAWDAAYDAAWSAIVGLIAYDDCAHMLDCTPDELRVLHALGEERAILFVPASNVYSEEKITESICLALFTKVYFFSSTTHWSNKMNAQVKIKLVNTEFISNFYFRDNQETLARQLLSEGNYRVVCELSSQEEGEDAAEMMFDLTNNPSRQEEREQIYGRLRSVSVGDIVEVDGVDYLCASNGWIVL